MLKSKKIRTMLTLVLTFALLAGSLFIVPTGSQTNVLAATKIVKSLKLKKSAVTIDLEDTKFVPFKVKASKGASKKVTAKSSNKKVASIEYIDNEEIGIYGNKPGTATITVTTKGKNAKGKALSKKIKVTVRGDTTYYAKRLKNYIKKEDLSGSGGEYTAVFSREYGGSDYLYSMSYNENTGDFKFFWVREKYPYKNYVSMSVALPNTTAEITYLDAYHEILDERSLDISSIEYYGSTSSFDIFVSSALDDFDRWIFSALGVGLKELGFTNL